MLLDLGDTLIYFDQFQYQTHKEALLALLWARGYTQISYEELSSDIETAFRKSTKGEIHSTREFWEVILTHFGIRAPSSLVIEIEMFWNSQVLQQLKFYEKALSTLAYLHNHYQLALVSNCSVGMRGIIKSLGLNPFFNCITLSYEVGVRKPDPTIYLHALNCLELEADECIFIADQIHDLEGARAIGLKTVLIRQGENINLHSKEPTFKPDYEFMKISEIIRVL